MGRRELEERVGEIDSVSPGRSKQFGIQMPQLYTSGNVPKSSCPATMESIRELSASYKLRGHQALWLVPYRAQGRPERRG